MTTPTLVALNLGAELLYVVEQRLRAQQVAADTSLTVLTDIIEVLFDERLLKELERTPALGKHTYVKKLMEDVASVSVMRLDRFSMDKLWELMIMVFKWQITAIKPSEIFALTDRHLCGVTRLVPDHPVATKVHRYRSKLRALDEATPEERKILTRNSILSWMNDFNVKVSLLLKLGLQRNDGSFVSIANPNERTSKILANVGDNIYRYETATGPEFDAQSSNTDISEVSFLVQDILGNNEKKLKRGKFEHYFLQNPRRTRFEDAAGASDVCEFEFARAQRETSAIDDLFPADETTTTLHEDLLNLLAETDQNPT